MKIKVLTRVRFDFYRNQTLENRSAYYPCSKGIVAFSVMRHWNSKLQEGTTNNHTILCGIIYHVNYDNTGKYEHEKNETKLMHRTIIVYCIFFSFKLFLIYFYFCSLQSSLTVKRTSGRLFKTATVRLYDTVFFLIAVLADERSVTVFSTTAHVRHRLAVRRTCRQRIMYRVTGRSLRLRSVRPPRGKHEHYYIVYWYIKSIYVS